MYLQYVLQIIEYVGTRKIQTGSRVSTMENCIVKRDALRASRGPSRFQRRSIHNLLRVLRCDTSGGEGIYSGVSQHVP